MSYLLVELESQGFTITEVRREHEAVAVLAELATQNGASIAGGYARYVASPNDKPVPASDLDFFFEHESGFDHTLGVLQMAGYKQVRNNPMCLTLKNEDAEGLYRDISSIQLIRPSVLCGKPLEIISQFDFSISRAVILTGSQVLVDIDFLKDEQAKRLRIKHVACPISGMLRCIKYGGKGYFCPPSEALVLLEDWQNRDESYRLRIGELMSNPNLTQAEIDEMEALLRID